jgi:hypothetical protein
MSHTSDKFTIHKITSRNMSHTSEKFTGLHLDVEVLRVKMVQPYITILTTARKAKDIAWKEHRY